MEERRRAERIKTHVPVRYHKLYEGADEKSASSVTRDIGQGGIRFRTGEFVSMACRLILELDIPIFTKPLKAISKVAWIRKADSGNEYEVGNQFLEMSRKDKELISKYVENVNMYQEPSETGASSSSESPEENNSE